jgi:hypothetical protein
MIDLTINFIVLDFSHDSISNVITIVLLSDIEPLPTVMKFKETDENLIRIL